MNGKELLIRLGDVGQKYYDEAENCSVTKRIGHSVRRTMLIAAVIALTVLLVGCAVAYALRLQDLSIGKGTYTQYFDDEGKAIDPVEKEMDILSLYGHNGDDIQNATAKGKLARSFHHVATAVAGCGELGKKPVNIVLTVYT